MNIYRWFDADGEHAIAVTEPQAARGGVWIERIWSTAEDEQARRDVTPLAVRVVGQVNNDTYVLYPTAEHMQPWGAPWAGAMNMAFRWCETMAVKVLGVL